MKKISRALTAFLVLAAAPVLAADEDVLPVNTDDISKYRIAGDWEVRQNETRGSCFISRSDAEGYLVQMGLTKNAEYGYIGIFKKGADVTEGSEMVAIALNGNLYVGEVSKLVHGASGDYKGGYILANNKNIRLDLESASEMVVFPESPYTVTVNLEGVRNAIYEARKCTRELQGA
jgi:hypothetical protein